MISALDPQLCNDKSRHPNNTQRDRRIDFLLTRHFPNQPGKRLLLENLADLDPTPNKKFLPWLAKHWLTGWRPSKEQRQRFREDLSLYCLACRWKTKYKVCDLQERNIFHFTPATFGKFIRSRRNEIKRYDLISKIEKGKLVLCPGAELAYHDEYCSVIRIRSYPALGLLSHYGSWCTQDIQAHCLRGNGREHDFPFDLILTADNYRYLADHRQIQDRWDCRPSNSTIEWITEVRAKARDSFDLAKEKLDSACKQQVRLSETDERELISFPKLAVIYAEKFFEEGWVEFEELAPLARVGYRLATHYAIHVKRGRWLRAETIIGRKICTAKEYYRQFRVQTNKKLQAIAREKIYWGK